MFQEYLNQLINFSSLMNFFKNLKIKVIIITQFPKGFHLHCVCSVACNQLLKNNQDCPFFPAWIRVGSVLRKLAGIIILE